MHHHGHTHIRASAAPARGAGPRFSLSALAGGVVGLLVSSGCAAVGEDDQKHRNPYTTVSSAEETDAASDQDQSGEGGAADELAAGDPAAGAGVAGLSEDAMAQMLLDSEDFPFSEANLEEFRGTAYFHEHIGVPGEAYTQSFGDQECAEQMDTINERLVGEEPAEGLLREATQQQGAADESLFIWALGYADPPDREPLWDEVLDACEDATLESEDDTVTFASFEQDGFRGLTMDMTVDDGDEVHEFGGFSATFTYGSNLLMVSGVNVEAEDFEATVEAQAEKLAAFDAGG